MDLLTTWDDCVRTHVDAKALWAKGPDQGGRVVCSLYDLLNVMSLEITRIGATATVAILDDARKRGIGDEPVAVSFQAYAGEGRGKLGQSPTFGR
jgi:hypothetical protein